MEPVTLIVTALALGAAAGLKATAEQTVKDAYTGVKTLLGKYAGVSGSLDALEKKPESKNKQASLAEDLQDAGVEKDLELLAQAQKLVEAIEKSKLGATSAAAIGVNLKEIKAAYLKISDVTARNTGVQLEHGEFSGGVDISGIQAGVRGEPDPNA